MTAGCKRETCGGQSEQGQRNGRKHEKLIVRGESSGKEGWILEKTGVFGSEYYFFCTFAPVLRQD